MTKAELDRFVKETATQLGERAARVAQYLYNVEAGYEEYSLTASEKEAVHHTASGMASWPNPSPDTFLGRLAITAKRLGIS